MSGVTIDFRSLNEGEPMAHAKSKSLLPIARSGALWNQWMRAAVNRLFDLVEGYFNGTSGPPG